MTSSDPHVGHAEQLLQRYRAGKTAGGRGVVVETSEVSELSCLKFVGKQGVGLFGSFLPGFCWDFYEFLSGFWGSWVVVSWT